ncbi:MAG: 3'-5' exonuclease [Acidimicrobiales bacterium]|jgi:DNA polymerase III epsilon subunit family exonuclease|nr:3'-5' exonuclease [Acidimicrobiales bacterium]
MSDTVYSCFDVETTGLDSRRARVIEIAVVKVTPAGETVGEWSTLIDAGTPDLGRIDIHGIRPNLLVDAPTFSEVAGDLMAELAGCVPVAHNASFDVGFVTAEWARAGLGSIDLRALDTVPMARSLGLPGRLGDLSRALGVELNGAHRALDDSRALAGVLIHLLERGVTLQEVPLFEPPDPPPLPTGRFRQRSGAST